MTLTAPFKIGSRLLPALTVGDGTISLEYVGNDGGRMVYRWYVDCPAGEFSAADLKSGVQGCGTQEMFGTLLAFLGAAAESHAWRIRASAEVDEDETMFPPAVVEWAHRHGDELDDLRQDLEESGKNYIEE